MLIFQGVLSWLIIFLIFTPISRKDMEYNVTNIFSNCFVVVDSIIKVGIAIQYTEFFQHGIWLGFVSWRWCMRLLSFLHDFTMIFNTHLEEDVWTSFQSQIYIGLSCPYFCLLNRYRSYFHLKNSGPYVPGTLNNHVLMDVWWNNHFLY